MFEIGLGVIGGAYVAFLLSPRRYIAPLTVFVLCGSATAGVCWLAYYCINIGLQPFGYIFAIAAAFLVWNLIQFLWGTLTD